jgi:hypothetical protein
MDPAPQYAVEQFQTRDKEQMPKTVTADLLDAPVVFTRTPP